MGNVVPGDLLGICIGELILENHTSQGAYSCSGNNGEFCLIIFRDYGRSGPH